METIVTGDCLTVDMPDNINLVYCDPPYNTGNDFGAFTDQYGTIGSYVDYMVTRLERCWNHLNDAVELAAGRLTGCGPGGT